MDLVRGCFQESDSASPFSKTSEAGNNYNDDMGHFIQKN